ncbi:MAG: hypothetical protein JSU90_10910 [Nitrospiraceae bacterium]|nr:MAG: hypothetical protein JSU90_10910 [Nitrospiraceae bacterium]
MGKKMAVVFVAAAVCLFAAGNAFAAWTQAKGHSYNQLTLSYYNNSNKFTTIEKNSDGDVVRTDAKAFKNEEEEFSSTKVTYYGEYGLMDDLTAIFSGGWDYVRSNDILFHTEDKDSVSGVGDIIVGLRQKISNNIGAGILMSVQADVKIPEAYEYENPIDHQNLGDGQYDTTVKLVFGRGFSKGYTVFSAGYKYRFENNELGDLNFKPSDQFLVSLSGGYNATPWLSIRGQIDWNRAVGNAEVSDELVTYAYCCGVSRDYGEAVVILDTLGLEQSALSAGVALAFTISPNMQTVISYNTDLTGFGPFRTENAAWGQTYSIAFVYMH